MSYSSLYKRKMTAKGITPYERRFIQKSRSFNNWFDNSLAKESVIIDGVQQYAVFADQNLNNNKELSDDKYIMVKNGSNMQVGSLVVWRNLNWLVFSDENKTIQTHKQAKVKESNGFIKWMIGNKISGDGNGHPAYIQNQTLYTLGVSTSGNDMWIVNAKMTMYLPLNKETLTIKVGQRIFIGDMVFQVMFKDSVSRKGLVNFLLEQDFVNESRDNLELGIADYYTGLATDDNNEQEPSSAVKEVIVKGSDKARIGALVKYEASVFENELQLDEGITEWTIADVDGVAKVVEQTPKYISIRIENNFKLVGSVISIIGKTADGTFGSKSIRVISPY